MRNSTTSISPSFAALADLDELPPFYLQFFTAIVKPIATSILFGPPRLKSKKESTWTDVAKFVLKQMIQLAFLGLAVVQGITDTGKIAQVWREADVSVVSKFFVSLVVLSASSNLVAAASGTAMLFVTLKDNSFRAQHRLPEISPFENWGPVGSVYIISMVCLFLLLYVVMMPFCIPALVAYAYVSFPIWVVCFVVGSLLTFCFPPILAKLRGPWANESEMAVSELSDGYALLLASRDKPFLDTGLSSEAWTAYFVLPMVGPTFIGVFTPIAARLYAGHGYWPALTVTFCERHLYQYMGKVISSLTAKLNFAWLLL